MRELTPEMLQDLPLFHGLVNVRRSDPISSHKAIDELEKRGGAVYQRGLVLQFVKRWPGRTSRQLADLADRDRPMIARRLPDLARLGLVDRRDAGDGSELTWWPK